MRDAFIRTLIERARVDKRVFLIIGDLGFGVVEGFAAEFPERFVNAGVSEQSMIGVAAGLADSGYHPFVYSIANFPTFRCLEQLRNDVCYHKLPTTVVSVGAGFAYGALGYSHHAVEDAAVMRALPGMTVVSPADPWETSKATLALADLSSPSYLRLGKAGEPVLSRGVAGHTFEIGVPICYKKGKGIALLVMGSVLESALEAAALLEAAGTAVPSVYSVHTVAPINPRPSERSRIHSLLVTIEEHSLTGDCIRSSWSCVIWESDALVRVGS